jgi:hypothetical protein
VTDAVCGPFLQMGKKFWLLLLVTGADLIISEDHKTKLTAMEVERDVSDIPCIFAPHTVDPVTGLGFKGCIRAFDGEASNQTACAVVKDQETEQWECDINPKTLTYTEVLIERILDLLKPYTILPTPMAQNILDTIVEWIKKDNFEQMSILHPSYKEPIKKTAIKATLPEPQGWKLPAKSTTGQPNRPQDRKYEAYKNNVVTNDLIKQDVLREKTSLPPKPSFQAPVMPIDEWLVFLWVPVIGGAENTYKTDVPLVVLRQFPQISSFLSAIKDLPGVQFDGVAGTITVGNSSSSEQIEQIEFRKYQVEVWFNCCRTSIQLTPNVSESESVFPKFLPLQNRSTDKFLTTILSYPLELTSTFSNVKKRHQFFRNLQRAIRGCVYTITHSGVVCIVSSLYVETGKLVYYWVMRTCLALSAVKSDNPTSRTLELNGDPFSTVLPGVRDVEWTDCLRNALSTIPEILKLLGSQVTEPTGVQGCVYKMTSTEEGEQPKVECIELMHVEEKLISQEMVRTARVTLGIDDGDTLTKAFINKKFKEKATATHPDRNPEARAHSMFTAVVEARTILLAVVELR